MALAVVRQSTTSNVASGTASYVFTGVTPSIGNEIVCLTGAYNSGGTPATATFSDDATGGTNTYTNRRAQTNAGSGLNDAKAQVDDCVVTRTKSGLTITVTSASNTGLGGTAIEVIDMGTADVGAGTDSATSPVSTATGAMLNAGELVVGIHHHVPDTRSGSKALAVGTWTPAANNFPTTLFTFDSSPTGIYGIAAYTITYQKSTTATVFSFSPNPVSDTSPQACQSYTRAINSQQFNRYQQIGKTYRPAVWKPGMAA